MSLFLRHVQLQIQRKGAPNAKTLDGLRITAQAKRSITATPDASTVMIYGASPGSLQDLQTPGTVVRVLAGYQDQLASILSGTIRPGSLEITRQDGEVTAAMEVVDGRIAVRANAVSRAWDNVTSDEVISWAIQASGLARGTINPGKTVQYTRGFAAIGVVDTVFRQIAADTESTCVVQDGIVSFYPKGQSRRSTSLIISPTSGMIGSPKRVEDGRVEVVTLLQPTLRPGDGFQVDSDSLGGKYIARDVSHDIDSWDGNFYTTVVGTVK